MEDNKNILINQRKIIESTADYFEKIGQRMKEVLNRMDKPKKGVWTVLSKFGYSVVVDDFDLSLDVSYSDASALADNIRSLKEQSNH